MATEKQISSRVRNKVDLEKNWKMAEGKFKPLDGEIIVYQAEKPGDALPEGRTEYIAYPRFKVGNGNDYLEELPFMPVSEGATTITEITFEDITPEYIAFYLNGLRTRSLPDITWEEWCNSEFNTDYNLVIFDGYVNDEWGSAVVLDSNDNYLQSTDIVIPNEQYSIYWP